MSRRRYPSALLSALNGKLVAKVFKQFLLYVHFLQNSAVLWIYYRLLKLRGSEFGGTSISSSLAQEIGLRQASGSQYR